ncbi:thioredoxin 1 [Sporosarcina luteola]|nr:thioredoxin 1 [Sporosarcina luteola]
MSAVGEVTKETFQRVVVESNEPVLVDFYADGCEPCEIIAPILREFSNEYAGKVKFTKYFIDIDEVLSQSDEIITKYDVMGFPTLLLFVDGEVRASHLGSLSRSELIEFLRTAL